MPRSGREQLADGAERFEAAQQQVEVFAPRWGAPGSSGCPGGEVAGAVPARCGPVRSLDPRLRATSPPIECPTARAGETAAAAPPPVAEQVGEVGAVLRDVPAAGVADLHALRRIIGEPGHEVVRRPRFPGRSTTPHLDHAVQEHHDRGRGVGWSPGQRRRVGQHRLRRARMRIGRPSRGSRSMRWFAGTRRPADRASPAARGVLRNGEVAAPVRSAESGATASRPARDRGPGPTRP